MIALIIIGYLILGWIIGIIFATYVIEQANHEIIAISMIAWPMFILIFIMFHMVMIAEKISNKFIKLKQNGTKKF